MTVSSQRSALGASGDPTALNLGNTADVPFSASEVVARAPWGAGADQFGKVDEASRPGPMSLTVGHDHAIYVLDQVNARVVPFDAAGTRRAAIPIGTDTAEDLVVSGERLWLLIYEPGRSPGYRLAEHRLDGTRLQQLRLSREIQRVTGLFATGRPGAPDLWVEQEHDTQSLVVARGVGLPAGAQVVRVRGRAQVAARTEVGGAGVRLLAERPDDAGFRVKQIYPGNFTSAVLEVRTPLPAVAVENWAATARGVSLVVTMGQEADLPDDRWLAFRRIALVHRGGGEPTSVELAPEYATDTFRPTAFGPDGAVYQLQLTDEGVAILRWSTDDAGGAR
jgi:hypothetical protein